MIKTFMKENTLGLFVFFLIMKKRTQELQVVAIIEAVMKIKYWKNYMNLSRTQHLYVKHSCALL